MFRLNFMQNLNSVARKSHVFTRSIPTRSSSRLAGLESSGPLVTDSDALVVAPRAPPPFPSLRPFVSSSESSEEEGDGSRMLGWLRGAPLLETIYGHMDKKVFRSWSDLSEDRVKKITRDGITHLSFMPTRSALVLAAGDKQGNVAIWKCTEGDEVDGHLVSFSRLHAEYISGLHWQGSSLVTTSYDVTQPIRKLDLEAGSFDVLSVAEIEISCSTISSDLLYLGTNEGGLLSYDMRSSSAASPLATIHQKRLNSVEVHGNYLLTSSSDTTALLFDIRKTFQDKPLQTLNLVKSSHAARFSPSGNQVLTISFDDTLRTWSFQGGRVSLEAGLVISHNNNTGRWVLPFKPLWINDAQLACGNMTRGVDVFSAKTGQIEATLTSDLMTAIPPRLAHHPSLPFLAAATSSGRAHVWKGCM